ncbi:MAG: TonB-dependent receptor [Bacteroidota bacterium]
MTLNKSFKVLGLAALALICSLQFAVAQQGKVYGKVLDENGEIAVGATVYLKRGPTIVSGANVKTDGRYEIAKIDPGTYELEVKLGDDTKIYPLVIGPGEYEPMDLNLLADDGGAKQYRADGVVIEAHMGRAPLFTVDPVAPKVISRVELGQMATTRNIQDVAALAAGVTQPDHGDPMNMRGQRAGGTAMYIDGMKERGSGQVPQAAIDQVAVITGGIPAEFGDVTGGLIVITTWNPGMKGSVGKRPTRAERKAARDEMKRKKKGSSEGLDLREDEALSAMAL